MFGGWKWRQAMWGKFWIFVVAVSVSCVPSGPVTTSLDKGFQPVVSPPSSFVSPIDEIEVALRKAEDLRDELTRGRIDPESLLWRSYVGWEQRLETLDAEQAHMEDELRAAGTILLEPGADYSFILASFCVQAGKTRPVLGDGFQMGPMEGTARKWLPKILDGYGKAGIPQPDAQRLIWALLSGARFDELSPQQQADLLKIYPDAAVRFGNSMLESGARSLLDRWLPSQVQDLRGEYESLRSAAVDYRRTYEDVARTLAPRSGRTKPVEIGWLRMPGGYLLRATAAEGSYSSLRVDIHAPADLKPGTPFRPSDLVALPAEGQRLAISAESKRPERPSAKWTCDQVKKMPVTGCAPMTNVARKKVLAHADPKKFAKTRYASPPDPKKSMEEETDCSVFAYEIYKRSGFEYPLVTTGALACVRTFHVVPRSEGKPGDLILFAGHVGILSEDGKVISATMGGGRRRSTLDPSDRDFIPAITEYSEKALRRGAGEILQWRCP